MQTYRDIRIYCLILLIGALRKVSAQSGSDIACDTVFKCTGKNNNLLIPDPTDCSVYYKCSGSNLQRLQCPENQEFDSISTACAQAGRVRCRAPCPDGALGVRGAYEQLARPVATPAPQVETFIEDVDPCTGDYDNQCRRLSVTSVYFFPDPTDCFKYYECSVSARRAYHSNCPAGTAFDKNSRRCVNVGGQSCFQCPSTAAPTINPCSPTLVSDCQELGTDSSFPDPLNCDKYYLCSGGQLQSRSCAPGTSYDSARRDCLPSGATCHQCDSTTRSVINDLTPAPSPPTIDPCSIDLINECRGLSGLVKLGDIHNCNKYYECLDGNLQHKNCPAGSSFDQFSYQCVEEQVANCFTTSICPANRIDPCSSAEEELFDEDSMEEACQELGYYTVLSDPSDCTKYYECKNGRLSSSKSCPNGEIFDHVEGACSDKAGAICLMCMDPCTENLEDACSAVSYDINLPNKEDCTSYYQCKGSKLTLKQCSRNKAFDYITRKCANTNSANPPTCYTQALCSGQIATSTSLDVVSTSEVTTTTAKPTKTFATRPTPLPVTSTSVSPSETKRASTASSTVFGTTKGGLKPTTGHMNPNSEPSTTMSQSSAPEATPAIPTESAKPSTTKESTLKETTLEPTNPIQRITTSGASPSSSSDGLGTVSVTDKASSSQSPSSLYTSDRNPSIQVFTTGGSDASTGGGPVVTTKGQGMGTTDAGYFGTSASVVKNTMGLESTVAISRAGASSTVAGAETTATKPETTLKPVISSEASRQSTDIPLPATTSNGQFLTSEKYITTTLSVTSGSGVISTEFSNPGRSTEENRVTMNVASSTFSQMVTNGGTRLSSDSSTEKSSTAGNVMSTIPSFSSYAETRSTTLGQSGTTDSLETAVFSTSSPYSTYPKSTSLDVSAMVMSSIGTDSPSSVSVMGSSDISTDVTTSVGQEVSHDSQTVNPTLVGSTSKVATEFTNEQSTFNTKPVTSPGETTFSTINLETSTIMHSNASPASDAISPIDKVSTSEPMTKFMTYPASSPYVSPTEAMISYGITSKVHDAFTASSSTSPASSYQSTMSSTNRQEKTSIASSAARSDSLSTQKNYSSMITGSENMLSSGMAWSTKVGGTVTTAQPVDPCYRVEPCSPNSRVPDPEDCDKFFECENPGRGKSLLSWKRRQCKRGMKFDSINLECVDAAAAYTCQSACPGIIHFMSTNSNETLEGHPLSFTCSFFQPMQSSGAHKAPEISWHLNGLQISPTSSRIQILTTGADINGFYESTLRFRLAQYTDTGTIQCRVEYQNNRMSIEEVDFEVLARPIVTIDPMSKVVAEGESLVLLCKYFVPTHDPSKTNLDFTAEFRWYRNGNLITKSDSITQIYSNLQKSNLLYTVQSGDENLLYSCTARNEAGESFVKAESNIIVYPRGANIAMCPEETIDGITWPKSPLTKGTKIRMECPDDQIGEATRECLPEDNEEVTDTTNGQLFKTVNWGEPNLLNCVDQDVMETQRTAIAIKDGIGIDNATYIAEAVTELEETSLKNASMTPGNIKATVDTVSLYKEIRKENAYKTEILMEELKAMVNTVSNLLDEKNEDSWETIEEENELEVISLMETLDLYGEFAAAQTETIRNIQIGSKNLMMQLECVLKNATRTVVFPQIDINNVQWMDGRTDKIMMEKETLDAIRNRVPGELFALSSTYYKTLDSFVPDGEYEDVASRVLSLSVYGLTDSKKLNPPISLELMIGELENENLTANCGFWDYNLGKGGNWSTQGCNTFSNGTIITCECDHLTNFAILMTSTKAHGTHGKILSIITIVGLIISLVCLVMTVILYISMWKHIKSHHAVVLINLCIALFVANALFLGGVDKTRYELLCTIISVLLHYFYLAAFFIMLVEAIQLMLYVVFVFHVRRKRETTILLLCGWLLPAGVVGATMGITRLDGYGTDQFCWLDIESNLKWAFIGPVLLIIAINIFILIIVLKRAANSANNLRVEKKKKSRIRSAMWNIIVITPIIGVAWLFGVFAVNEDTVVFQYIFTVFNSLQGLLIFIFHGICNRRVLDTVQSKICYSTPYSNSITHAFRSLLPGKVVPNAPCFKSKSQKTGKGRYSVKTPSTKETKRSRLKSDGSGKSSKSKNSKDSKANSIPSTPAFESPNLYPMMSEKEKVNMMEALCENNHMSWRNSVYKNGTSTFNDQKPPESVLSSSTLSNGFSTQTTDTDCLSSSLNEGFGGNGNYDTKPPENNVHPEIPPKEPVGRVLSSTSC